MKQDRRGRLSGATWPGLKAGLYVLTALLSTAQITPPQTTPAPPPPTAAPQPAMVRGHVVGADSGQPLRKAQVRATLVDPRPDARGAGPFRERSTTTDVDGKYELTDLAPGRYNITAFKSSYVSAAWGQTQPMQPGTPIDVKAGQTVERIDFTLQRGGVITGRIFDEY